MTAIASPSTTITREIPPNQVSTMAAYPNPSYAMSPGAEAIRAAVGRLGQRRPMYTSPDQIQAGAANPLLARDAAAAAMQPGGDGMSALAGMNEQPGAPGAIELGYTETPMGPDTQTAAGGIMGRPDFTTPAAWTQFFNQRGTRPGVAPRTPPVVAGSRVGSSMVPAYQPRPVSA